MRQELYRYQFRDGTPLSAVEESLLLAVLAVECLHGGSVVRLEGSYHLDPQKRTCLVDAETDVGRHIGRIFTGFLTREFGKEGFQVRKVTRAEGETVADHSCEL